MLVQNFGVINKEHYDMLWYFLEWSIKRVRAQRNREEIGAGATKNLSIILSIFSSNQ